MHTVLQWKPPFFDVRLENRRQLVSCNPVGILGLQIPHSRISGLKSLELQSLGVRVNCLQVKHLTSAKQSFCSVTVAVAWSVACCQSCLVDKQNSSHLAVDNELVLLLWWMRRDDQRSSYRGISCWNRCGSGALSDVSLSSARSEHLSVSGRRWRDETPDRQFVGLTGRLSLSSRPTDQRDACLSDPGMYAVSDEPAYHHLALAASISSLRFVGFRVRCKITETPLLLD